jgi:hypothetical protein
MMHVLLVMSNILFVLWIIGVLFVLWIISVEAQHVDAAGAGRTGRDLPDHRPLDRQCDGGNHQRQRAARQVQHPSCGLPSEPQRTALPFQALGNNGKERGV